MEFGACPLHHVVLAEFEQHSLAFGTEHEEGERDDEAKKKDFRHHKGVLFG